MTPYPQQLINAALPYWEAEAEIAKRFFESRPTKEQHLFWLRAQIWKERNPVDGYFNGIHKELARLTELFPRVEQVSDRHQFAFMLRQIVEEYNHYVLFADIFEMLTGRRLAPDDALQLQQEKRLAEMRRELVESGSPLDKAAVLFTEGGGARLFREGAKVGGGPLEDAIAHAMNVIYHDEKDHFREGAKDAVELIGSETDAERMKAGIVRISRQRVAMRLEMFGKPMTGTETERFIDLARRAVEAGTFREAG